MDEYINIQKVAETKGLKSTRSLRIAIQKGKYIARKITVRGGSSYEILLNSLEPEIQKELTQCTALVPVNKPRETFTAGRQN